MEYITASAHPTPNAKPRKNPITTPDEMLKAGYRILRSLIRQEARKTSTGECSSPSVAFSATKQGEKTIRPKPTRTKKADIRHQTFRPVEYTFQVTADYT